MRTTIATAMSSALTRRISRYTPNIVAYRRGPVSAPGRPGSVPGAVDLQVAALAPGPQHLLVELAHGRLGHLVDEGPVLRHLPAGHLAIQERGQRGRVGR